MNDITPPQNIEGLEVIKVNKKVWRKIAHETKSFDIRFQHLQDLILKSLTFASYMGKQLFKNRLERDLAKIKENFKILLKRCADSVLLLGKANLNLLDLRRNILPALNYNYRQLSFPPEDHPKLLFWDDLPRTLKEIAEIYKVGQTLTQRSPSQNFNQPKPFLFRGQGHQHPRGKPRQNWNHSYQHQQRKFH